MTYILGINSAYHESSACLIKDGNIIAAVEEERFNRVKHGKEARVDNPDELPVNAIEFCLAEASKLEGRDVTLEDIAHVGYSLDPQERLKRNLHHEHPYEVTPDDFGTREGESEFESRNWKVERKLRQAGFKGEVQYLRHHDCHAASSFLVSPYEDAAVLVVDGIGESESTTMYKGNGNKLEWLANIDFPNSLGFLWEKMSKYLGFSGYDACKVMGLASYGDAARYREQFRELVKVDEKGLFTIDDAITRFRNDDYSGIEELFGLAKRNEPVKNARDAQAYADIAADLQEITEEIILKLAKTLKNETGSKYLCLSGGVALNCVANGRLIKEGIFEDIFVQPAANDAGTAIGAAYYIWNQLLDKPRNYVFESPYLGPSFSDKEIQAELDRRGLKYTRADNVEQATAKLVADGNIVAWFQGAMELGPRALGNRTILADSRKATTVEKLNHQVKHREPFRPFCPSVIEEKANEWFDTGERIANPARYMLAAFDVLPDRRESIPAVTHVDGTSRIQTVRKETNPKYYKLIEEFEKLTGIPVVLNTSFNDREPIVCSPQDAVNTFLKTRVDYLAIGNFLVSRGENNGG